jgi:large subunit ribosomal protein L13
MSQESTEINKKDINNKTKFVNAQTAKRDWYLIDAKGKNLGRLCCEIARILRGKRKPDYTPHWDNGDFVIITNAKDIVYTGKRKGKQTIYRRYTGYPGGLREEPLEDLLKRRPEKVIFKVVKGMMPKNTTLGDAQMTKLKIYAGAEHPHSAQNPTLIENIPAI